MAVTMQADVSRFTYKNILARSREIIEDFDTVSVPKKTGFTTHVITHKATGLSVSNMTTGKFGGYKGNSGNYEFHIFCKNSSVHDFAHIYVYFSSNYGASFRKMKYSAGEFMVLNPQTVLPFFDFVVRMVRGEE